MSLFGGSKKTKVSNQVDNSTTAATDGGMILGTASSVEVLNDDIFDRQMDLALRQELAQENSFAKMIDYGETIANDNADLVSKALTVTSDFSKDALAKSQNTMQHGADVAVTSVNKAIAAMSDAWKSAEQKGTPIDGRWVIAGLTILGGIALFARGK